MDEHPQILDTYPAYLCEGDFRPPSECVGEIFMTMVKRDWEGMVFMYVKFGIILLKILRRDRVGNDVRRSLAGKT